MEQSMNIVALILCLLLFQITNSQFANQNGLPEKREFIRQMARNAWAAYTEHAWGDEALQPQTNNSYEYWFGNGSGQTIVASMSTLWVMDLKDEFEHGKKWIEEKLDFKQIDQDVRVFYSVTHYIGGLLSCFALTRDEMFLNNAKEIAEVLKPAYNSLTGLSYYNINPHKGTVNDARPFLYSIGFQQPEYIYLEALTNDTQIGAQLGKIRKFIQEIDKPNGLYMQMVDIEDGKWGTNKSSLSRTGRDFYTNLIKSFVQSDGKDVKIFEMYKTAAKALWENGLIATSNKSGLVYARDFDKQKNQYTDSMSYLSCYLGGMFALGGVQQFAKQLHDAIVLQTQSEEESLLLQKYWDLGRNLTETCHEAELKTKTGLAPAVFYFNQDGVEDATTGKVERFNTGPELAESYFTLYRLTRNQKYRDYAWQLAQSIHRHCRTPASGYSDLNDVNTVPTSRQNYQRPAFLSGTLKFLYLTFTDDSVLSTDDWIFTSAGHPLPICGKSVTYPVEKCRS